MQKLDPRSSNLLILIGILAGLMTVGLFLDRTLAQGGQEQDFYYFEGRKNPVTVRLDQLALLAREKVSADQIKEFSATFKLRFIREYQGGLFILGVEQPLSRGDLVKFVREVQRKGESLVREAGLVVLVRGSENPSMLGAEFIVGFKSNVDKQKIDALNAANKVQIVMANPYIKYQYLLRVTNSSPLDSLAMAQLYHDSPLAEYAYPNFVNVYVDLNTIPNDPLFGNQWHHFNTGQGGGTVDADADTSMAWDITQGASGTIVSVLENGGFDITHPDLTPNFWVNPGEIPGNGLDDDGDGFVDDVNGWDFVGCAPPTTVGCGDNNPSPASATTEDHGTAVAGVAAARGNNNLGVIGACPNCSIMLLRTGYANSDWAKSLAFGYAQARGSRIITNSWGGGTNPNTITAINNVTAAGVVVLFAAGNTTSNVCTGATQDPIVSLPGVIAVSSSTNQDRKVAVSAVGNCIDILAPSHRGYNASDPFTGTLNITTTDRQGTAGYNNTNLVTNCPSTEASPPPTNARDYTSCFGGTSSATPLAAGIVGLVLTVNPTLTRLQVQQLLQDTADKIEDSVGAYSQTTGFSTPASGVATHSWGRINAFEAVRVVAPVAQGGRGGVDIFLRDNRLDWGNTEQPSNTLFEATRGYIGHWQSMDIKVDAPPYQTPPTAATFDAFVDETPSALSGDVNRVYVRVRNRGPVTATTVNVKLHWSQFGTALAALPNDFWTAFPNNSSNTAQWHPLDCATSPPAPLPSTVCQVGNLAYSGASVAATLADATQIVQFNFPAPPVDPMLPNHFCLLAMVDSPQDPISATSKATFVVDSVTPNDNNVTHRNYTDLPTDSDRSFEERFFVRNPTNRAIRAALRLQGPRDWKFDVSPLGIDKPFGLQPQQEVLVTLRVTTPSLGLTADVTVTQEELETKEQKVMGGLTYRFRPQGARPVVPTGGLVAPYLIGTYDLRDGARTMLHILNPTAKHLRVLVVFFDDNEKALRCFPSKLTPNDLLEIDVLERNPGARFGVVKVVALNAQNDTPEVGIVGNQRIFFRGRGATENALHPVPEEILKEDLNHIWPVCKAAQ